MNIVASLYGRKNIAVHFMKILYVSFSKLEYSVNAVYLKGLEQNGAVAERLHLKGKWASSYLKALKEYWRRRKEIDFIMVGYNSPQLAFWLNLFSRKKIIYNALCSVYERFIVSRAVASKRSLKGFYYWLIDFLGVHSSDLIMLESQAQIKYFHKLFGVSPQKCFRAWTGSDEDRFFYDPTIAKADTFTVIFRGGLLPESGAEFAVKAAKILENENLKIIMHANDQELPKIQKLINQLQPKNFKLITEFLSDQDLRALMQKCHLSLGQLSNHPRLTRTIPHKCYESLALGLPYLTAANIGVLELLKPGETCLTCEPTNAESLAKQIFWAKNHPVELAQIVKNGHRLYQEKLTPKILAGELLKRLI